MILTLSMIVAAIFGLAFLGLAVAFMLDPEQGMRLTQHRGKSLPDVTVARYIGFAALALGSAAYGDSIVILVLFVVLAGISLFDAFAYASDNESWWVHAAVGAFCVGVVAISGIAVVLGY